VKRTVILITLALMVMITLSGCAPQSVSLTEQGKSFTKASIAVATDHGKIYALIPGLGLKTIPVGIQPTFLTKDKLLYITVDKKSGTTYTELKDLHKGKTYVVFSPDMGWSVSIVTSPERKWTAVTIWPEGVPTDTKVLLFKTEDLIASPEDVHPQVITEGKLYSHIKWVAAVSDSGELLYVGSNGVPSEEGLVLRKPDGGETLIVKASDKRFSHLIGLGEKPYQQIVELYAGTIYIAGPDGIYAADPNNPKNLSRIFTSTVAIEGLDVRYGYLTAWGYERVKPVVFFQAPKMREPKPINSGTLYGPMVLDPEGNLVGLRQITEKSVYAWAISVIDTSSITENTETATVSHIDLIRFKEGIKSWDIYRTQSK